MDAAAARARQSGVRLRLQLNYRSRQVGVERTTCGRTTCSRTDGVDWKSRYLAPPAQSFHAPPAPPQEILDAAMQLLAPAYGPDPSSQLQLVSAASRQRGTRISGRGATSNTWGGEDALADSASVANGALPEDWAAHMGSTSRGEIDVGDLGEISMGEIVGGSGRSRAPPHGVVQVPNASIAAYALTFTPFTPYRHYHHTQQQHSLSSTSFFADIPPQVIEVDDHEHEADFILQRILRLRDAPTPPPIGIIYRTNSQASAPHAPS